MTDLERMSFYNLCCSNNNDVDMVFDLRFVGKVKKTKKNSFSLLPAGGQVLPVSRRAANEDAEDVNFAPRRIEVRATQLCTIQTHKHNISVTQVLNAEVDKRAV